MKMIAKRIALILYFSMVSGFAACGDDVPGSPDGIGQKISDVYHEFLGELKPMLASKPEAATIAPKLKDLREKYIQKFVALGKAQQAMSENDRRAVSAANMKANSEKQSKDRGLYDFGWLNEALAHYNKVDPNNAGKMLADVSILSQYAYFDLLKKQAPEEAKRLGIE